MSVQAIEEDLKSEFSQEAPGNAYEKYLTFF